MPKDFLCNMSALVYCVCVCVFLAHHWHLQHLWCPWTSSFSTGSSSNKFAVSPIDSQMPALFSDGLNCMISLHLLATTTHTYHDIWHLNEQMKAETRYLWCPCSMSKCSCVKWCWEKWIEAGSLCRDPSLICKGLSRLKADSARNLVLAGKHPWSILEIILLPEWTWYRVPTWFNLLFQ